MKTFSLIFLVILMSFIAVFLNMNNSDDSLQNFKLNKDNSQQNQETFVQPEQPNLLSDLNEGATDSCLVWNDKLQVMFEKVQSSLLIDEGTYRNAILSLDGIWGPLIWYCDIYKENEQLQNECRNAEIVGRVNQHLNSILNDESLNINIDFDSLSWNMHDVVDFSFWYSAVHLRKNSNFTGIESTRLSVTLWSLMVRYFSGASVSQVEDDKHQIDLLMSLAKETTGNPNLYPQDGFQALISAILAYSKAVSLDVFESLAASMPFEDRIKVLESFYYRDDVTYHEGWRIFLTQLQIGSLDTVERKLSSEFSQTELSQFNDEFLDKVVSEISLVDEPEFMAVIKYLAFESVYKNIQIKWLKVYLELNPGDIYALSQLLNAEEECCHIDNAIQLRNAVIQTGVPEQYEDELVLATNTIVNSNWLNGNLDDTIYVLEETLSIIKNEQLTQQLADILLDADRFTEASTYIQELLFENPESEAAINSYGLILENYGDVDEAITWFQDALKRYPDNSPIANNLGTLLQAKGRFDEALEFYNQSYYSATNENGEYFALKNIALLHFEQGNFDDAKEVVGQLPINSGNHLGEIVSALNVLLESDGDRQRVILEEHLSTYQFTQRRLTGNYNKKVFQRIYPYLNEHQQQIVTALYLE